MHEGMCAVECLVGQEGCWSCMMGSVTRSRIFWCQNACIGVGIMYR